MTTNLPPGEIRLQREAVRIVSIPYSTAFLNDRASSGRNLASATIHGMKKDPIVKKQTLKMRLEDDDFGVWYCPRLSGGHKGTRIHTGVKEKSGYCTESYEQNPDGKCGRKLEVESTHWHELAEAFGFLESHGDSYAHGKFGSVARFLDHLLLDDQKQIWTPDCEGRARRALYLATLLENHADFVLPVLWTTTNPSLANSDLNKRVLDIFRNNLKNKLNIYTGSNLPASQAVLRIRQMLQTKILEFTHYEEDENKPDKNKPKGANSIKTQYSYVARTRTYLFSQRFFEDMGGNRGYKLTSDGERLVSALQQKGVMVSEETCHLSPSFEAIHDVFSFTMERYMGIFEPILNHQTIEDIIMRTLIPDTRPVSWKKYRGEIAALLPQVVSQVGNKLAPGAHVDTVRLALFLHQVGKGLPTILDDPEGSVDVAQVGMRDNAIINVAAKEADRYVLGSARVGRRLWSINLLRNLN